MATGARPRISQPPINFSLSMQGNVLTVGTLFNLPTFKVPARAAVRIASRSGNAYPVGVMRHRGDLGSQSEIKVPPNQFLIYPVRDLNEIWLNVTNGDWADVIVSAGAIDA